jgi:all-trans-retinol dehydrogenase (NAD+)
MKDIDGKVVLVTGGASGIGRLMCLLFAGRKAKVIAWDINGGALNALEDEAAGKELFIRGMICDVSDKEDIYKQASKLKVKYGPVDVLINNAGVVSGVPFIQLPDDKIKRTMDVNVLALFWTCKTFLPSMIERDSGHIVTIASAAGIIGVRGLADYSASKYAAVGFDESLRMELRRLKSAIRTTVVCPFFIDTGMFAGVKTRFPLLLPILKPTYAAGKIVQAVLKNKQRLVMPRFVNLVFLLRLFPLAFLDFMADLVGISRAMDGFTGRTSDGENA